MTQAAIARQTIERERLLAEHRIVRVEMQSEHCMCTARVDMPGYDIRQGEVFHLVQAASYPGYAYLIRWDEDWTKHACSCQGYAGRSRCKHVDLVQEICVSRFHQGRPVPARLRSPMLDRMSVPAMAARHEASRLGATQGFRLMR